MPRSSASPRSRSRSRSPRRSRKRSRSDDSRDDALRRPKRSRSRDNDRQRRGEFGRRPSAHDNDDADAKRERHGAGRDAEEMSLPPPPLTTRQRAPVRVGPAGGVYVPPFKLAQMMAQVDDRESAAYQRLTWDALRKSLNGIVNKVNVSNIKHVLPELFAENLVRGRGLLCRSLMKSQAVSPSFTPVYAALVAVVNTKFPEIGELLLHRVVAQFKRAYARNDKPVCLAALNFIAHLVNQQVVHELVALEILALLLEHPSDDSVESAAEFVRECGAMLQDVAPAGLAFVFDRLRDILHEGMGVTKRTQYVIEGLYAVRRAGFEAAGHPAVPPELDLVETEDQITHEVSLDSKVAVHDELNVFREDPEFAVHEAEYAAIRREILGDEDEDEEAGGDGEEESTDEEGDGEESEEEEEDGDAAGGRMRGDGGAGGPIQDETGTDLVNLRRTIYLTLQSSLDFEEAGHKLLKMQIPKGLESELATMIMECCAQEKTFTRFYALLGERFSKLNAAYADAFAECFIAQYRLVHRLETNKLRNVARLFAHLLATDGLDWRVLAAIRLTEADTTSSSRIFVKILFQDLAENMGLRSLNERLQDPAYAAWFQGLFPQDSMKNMRFAINFFTSIGLGGLTDRMREILADLPRLIAEKEAAEAAARAKLRPSPSTSATTSPSSSGGATTSTTSTSSSSSGDTSSTRTTTSSSSATSGGSSSYSDGSSGRYETETDDSRSSDEAKRPRRRRGRKSSRADTDSESSEDSRDETKRGGGARGRSRGRELDSDGGRKEKGGGGGRGGQDRRRVSREGRRESGRDDDDAPEREREPRRSRRYERSGGGGGAEAGAGREDRRQRHRSRSRDEPRGRSPTVRRRERSRSRSPYGRK